VPGYRVVYIEFHVGLILVGKVVGFTLRQGHAVKTTSTWLIRDLLIPNNISSVLFNGTPSCGKSTVLREIARSLSLQGNRVENVDTSSEIGGPNDIPHSSIGWARRISVPSRQDQHRIMVEAVRNHTPDVVIVDDLQVDDVQNNFIQVHDGEIRMSGVEIVATMNVKSLKELCRWDNAAQNTIMARLGFDIIVEFQSFNKWVFYRNVSESVKWLVMESVKKIGFQYGNNKDSMDGPGPMVELRETDELGRVSFAMMGMREYYLLRSG
jgi:stage III sporulation protein SpoIIIAA